MKKLILNVVFLFGTASALFAQSFTFTATSASYNSNGNPASGDGAFYSYQPNAGSTTVFVDNACSVLATASGANAIGGFAPDQYDATTATPSRPGTIFYGGSIRNTYNTVATVCTQYTPSFGFTFNNGRTIDMTNAGNQKLAFSYTNNTGTDITVAIQLFDKPNYTAMITPYTITLVADAQNHNVNIDLSANATGDLSAIAQVSFTYPSDTKSPDFGVSFANIVIGGNVTPTLSSASVTSSALYPNPVSDIATVELNLVAPSEVKIAVYDVMGKEVMTVANGTYYEMKQDFSVAGLNKGVYNVVYYVNGKAAKAERLMVK